MKKIALCFLLVIAYNFGYADSFVMTKNYQKAYEQVLSLKFQSAGIIIEKERINQPDNLAYIYLHNYIDFLKVIISEENEAYHQLIDNKNSRLQHLNSIPKNSPWHLYAQAQVNLQSAIARVKFGDNAKAGIDINKAYRQLTLNNTRFPDFNPNKAALGLVHVLIGSIPDSYKWITNLLGIEGSVNEGLLNLQSLIINPGSDDPYLFVESFFITTFITFNLATNEHNLALINNCLQNEKLNAQIKSNPLLIYGVSAYYLNQGKNEEALSLLLNRPLDNAFYPFHYLDYLTGAALLNKLDPKSKIYFLKYVTHFKGRNFIKSAYHSIAWAYLVENNIEGYQTYISRIRYFGFQDIDNDKVAQLEADTKLQPHVELLSARLLFDGGYYTKAHKVLSQIKMNALTDQEHTEWLYRQARVHHKMGDIDKAEEMYLITYQQGKDLTAYYAANSLINLGAIYETKHNHKQALWCYETCLTLNFTQYKTSIHQKAKSGINRLSN